jgi:hypothetical protein
MAIFYSLESTKKDSRAPIAILVVFEELQGRDSKCRRYVFGQGSCLLRNKEGLWIGWAVGGSKVEAYFFFSHELY